MPDDSQAGPPDNDDPRTASHTGPSGGSNPPAASLPGTPTGGAAGPTPAPGNAGRNASVVLATTGLTDAYHVPAATSGLDDDLVITAVGTALTKKAAQAVRDAAERDQVVLRDLTEEN